MVSQFSLDLNKELIVDNFAGGGGASTGIFLATGRHVDHAINHDSAALGMHRINHPQTVHHCEDVFDVVPRIVCDGRPVALGWFSPDCKHFSKAKGGKPLSKKIRGLAFVMLRWAKYGVRCIYMENVEEIQTWGPLLPDGRPDKRYKGRTWLAFLDALGAGVAPNHPDLPEMLEVLGDSVTRDELVRGFGCVHEQKEIRACDLGAPTIRKRLYMIARKDGQPIVWPKSTHAPRKVAKKLGLKPHRAIAECIDWSLTCHSIFLSREEARQFRCKRPLATSTLRRIAKGIDRYVLKAERPFLVSLTHQGGDRIEPIDEPARTLTGANRGEKALCQPEMAPFLTEHANASAQRCFPADEPMRTQCGEVKGGHFSLVSANIARDFGQSIGQSMDKPAPTVMPDGQGKTKLISAGLVRTAHGEQDKNGKKRGKGALPVDEPAPTTCASNDAALFTANLVNTANSKTTGRGPNAWPVDEPSRTVTAAPGFALVSGTVVGAGGPVYSGKPKPLDEPGNTQTTENHSALATVHLARFNGDHAGREDGAARNQSMEEPVKTLDTSNRFALIGGTLVQTGYGEREGQAPRALDPTKPGGTAVAGGCKQALATANMVKLRGTNVGHDASDPGHTVSAGGLHQTLSTAYLAQHNDGFNSNPGHSATEPCSTISGTGSQQGVVTGNLAAYYGNDQDGQGVDESLRTVTTKERFGFSLSEAWAPPMTESQVAGARRVAAFLREYGVEFEGEFATVGGFVIVDIGMRMLTPRELFRAQGFPEEYVIDRSWVIDPKTCDLTEVHLTKEQQIRMCGNSVCPDVAAALIRANQPELSIPTRVRKKRRTAEVVS